jgi:4-amino-4-deoxy-L-arabinose transferase-like glycosyltransferase
MALLLVASFAARLAAWSYWGTGTIESEGAEYAKIAENLRNGVGYVGLVSPGPQVLFNPLFPFLIAGVSLLTHNCELAGRLVALVIGALLPLPILGVATRLFNRRVGFIAAMLTVLHPLLLHLSFTVYSEGPYATLLLSAIYVVVRALNDSWTKRWTLVGGAFALCYLLRAEAFAAFAIAVLFALTITNGSPTLRGKRAAYALAVFLVLALPEVIFIYLSTGRVMLETKSTILFSYTGGRIVAAETSPERVYVSAAGQRDVPSSAPNADGGYPSNWEGKWAFYGINANLEPTGTAMRTWADVAREPKLKLTDMLRLVARGIRLSAPMLVEAFSSRWLGAPFLPALALLGVFCRPWHGPKAPLRLFVMLVTAAPAMATVFVLWGDPRYFFVFVPLLSIWAANGLFEIGQWMMASSAAAGRSVLALRILSEWVVPGLAGVVLFISPFKPVTSHWQFSDSAPAYRIDKEVGVWLGGQQHRPSRIMDLSLPLSYHAGAQQHVYFPYATGELALRYLDVAEVDYVVLRRGHKFTRYYEEWLTHGVPDPRAEPLQLPSAAAADRFVIYRWHRDYSRKVVRSAAMQEQAETPQDRGSPSR